VARWWNHDPRLEAIERAFGTVVDGLDPTEIFVVSTQGHPFGLLQRYTFADNPQYLLELTPILDVPASAISMDYLVGEPHALRRGLGTSMLQVAIRSTWLRYPLAPALVVPVVAANIASWRVLERAGFHRAAEGPLEPDNPIDDRLHYIYRIDRPA
jgi:aminoglycoside 6'-N-acetyltransferase